MADVGLALPDFRAAERTFSLIVQVAGRAGRFRDDGEVIIQSFCPEHVAIQYAARMKVEAFYKRELALRKELIFPPFSRLLRVLVRSRDMEAAETAAEEFAVLVREACKQNSKNIVDVIGAAPAPLERGEAVLEASSTVTWKIF